MSLFTNIPRCRWWPRRALAGALCVAAVLAATPASAQSLEELIKRNEALTQAVEALMQEVKTLKQEVRATARTAAEAKAAAEAAPGPVQAASLPPKVVRSGQKDVELRISGQIDRGVLYADDGADGNYFFVDNDNSSTRLRLDGKGRVDQNFSVGSTIEVELRSNSTVAVNQFNDRGADGTDFLTQRRIELYLDDARYGRLWLGQGSTASDGSAERDLAGTSTIITGDVKDFAGGMLFRRSDVGGGTPGLVALQTNNPTIGATFKNFDGLSRDDRVRYDTPEFMGFRAKASAVADGRWDVGGTYGADIAGAVAVEAAVAFAQESDSLNQVSGSISALHKASGISLTYASAFQHDLATATAPGREDRTYRYIKLGWQWPIFGFGKTFTGVDFYEGTDISQNGDYSLAWGVGVVQKIDRAALELFLGYRNFRYDRDAASFDDINAVLTGARIKF